MLVVPCERNGAIALREAASEVGPSFEVILVLVVPSKERDPQRFGDGCCVDPLGIWLVVEGVGGGIPELDVIAESPFLLQSEIPNGHLDLYAGCISWIWLQDISHTHSRPDSVHFGISASIIYCFVIGFDRFAEVLALEEVVLVDGGLTAQAIRPYYEVKGFK